MAYVAGLCRTGNMLISIPRTEDIYIYIQRGQEERSRAYFLGSFNY